jgi:hypothetical protein
MENHPSQNRKWNSCSFVLQIFFRNKLNVFEAAFSIIHLWTKSMTVIVMDSVTPEVVAKQEQLWSNKPALDKERRKR